MRVNVHDYAGHPFQVQLSRSLAARGHEVLHGYSTQHVTGRGKLALTESDPKTLRIQGVTADRPMIRYSPVGRTRYELSYAQAWRRELERERFDVVVACNVPLFTLSRLRRFLARRNQRWVLWHQDIWSLGIAAEAARKLPGALAAPMSRQLQRMERAQVASADRVVAIGDGFVRQYSDWGLRADHVQVIPNWAPLDDLVCGARENEWSARNAIPVEPVRLLYAGTLGRKHNPLLLLDLLDSARARGVEAVLTVVSEGAGADDLKIAAAGRADVRILDYQPAEDLPAMLASADVLLALLEPDAAEFSVPSKVHSYLCAGRPIVALMPQTNPAALDVQSAGGCVAPPTHDGARQAAGWLADAARDAEGLAVLGKRARGVAEERFDIERITDRFEVLLHEAAGRPIDRAGAPHFAITNRSSEGTRQ
jgi:glycosyltransferase involved in cell wall biosynthesis